MILYDGIEIVVIIEASYIYWYIKMSIILFETRAFKTYFSFCSSITNVYFHYEEDNKKKKEHDDEEEKKA